MSRHTVGSLLVAGCATTWGFIGIIVRELDMPAMAIVFFRVLFSAGSLVAVLAATGRLRSLRLGSWALPSLGVLLAIHWTAYFAAVQETSVASAVVVTYAAPVLMALIAPMLLRERVTRVTVLALGVSVVGVGLIAAGGGEGSGAVRLVGVALAVGAAVTQAFLIVLIKRYSEGVDPIAAVFWTDVVAGVCLAPFAAVGDYSLGAGELGYLALLGVVLTGLTGTVWMAGLQRVPATTAGILAYMEPVAAAVLAAVLLSEALTVPVVVGGLAIVAAGVAVIRLAPPQPVAAPDAPL